MKIQLSPIRIVKDVMTVWNEPGPEVDVVMDLKKLTFKEGSLDGIFTFHVLDHLFESEVVEALTNWKKLLKKDCDLFVVVDDLEYIARAFVGGDIDTDVFNQLHAHPMNFRGDNLIKYFTEAGFKEDLARIWYADVPDLFPRKHYELVMAVKKHE
jgi:predicted SAM-dependent methyltransferase